MLAAVIARMKLNLIAFINFKYVSIDITVNVMKNAYLE